MVQGAVLGLEIPLIAALLAACCGDDTTRSGRGGAATGIVNTGQHVDQTSQEGTRAMSTQAGHYVLADQDSEARWFLGTLATIKADSGRTGGLFGLVEFTHPAGFATPLHVHHDEDEAFYVLAGSMRGICGDQPWQATTGGFVWLPRDIPHGYRVEGDEPLRTLALSLPAGFEQFVREASEPAAARVMPPPGPPDFDKLNAAAKRYGQTILGPLELVSHGTPAASPGATP